MNHCLDCPAEISNKADRCPECAKVHKRRTNAIRKAAARKMQQTHKCEYKGCVKIVPAKHHYCDEHRAIVRADIDKRCKRERKDKAPRVWKPVITQARIDANIERIVKASVTFFDYSPQNPDYFVRQLEATA